MELIFEGFHVFLEVVFNSLKIISPFVLKLPIYSTAKPVPFTGYHKNKPLKSAIVFSCVKRTFQIGTPFRQSLPYYQTLVETSMYNLP